MLRTQKPLTPFEERLYALIGDRFTRDEIAKATGVDRNSLQTYIYNLYHKILFPAHQGQQREAIIADRDKMKAELGLPGAD